MPFRPDQRACCTFLIISEEWGSSLRSKGCTGLDLVWFPPVIGCITREPHLSRGWFKLPYILHAAVRGLVGPTGECIKLWGSIGKKSWCKSLEASEDTPDPLIYRAPERTPLWFRLVIFEAPPNRPRISPCRQNVRNVVVLGSNYDGSKLPFSQVNLGSHFEWQRVNFRPFYIFVSLAGHHTVVAWGSISLGQLHIQAKQSQSRQIARIIQHACGGTDEILDPARLRYFHSLGCSFLVPRHQFFLRAALHLGIMEYPNPHITINNTYVHGIYPSVPIKSEAWSIRPGVPKRPWTGNAEYIQDARHICNLLPSDLHTNTEPELPRVIPMPYNPIRPRIFQGRLSLFPQTNLNSLTPPHPFVFFRPLLTTW